MIVQLRREVKNIYFKEHWHHEKGGLIPAQGVALISLSLTLNRQLDAENSM